MSSSDFNVHNRSWPKEDHYVQPPNPNPPDEVSTLFLTKIDANSATPSSIEELTKDFYETITPSHWQKTLAPQIKEPEIQTYHQGKQKPEILRTGAKAGDGMRLGKGKFGEVWKTKSDEAKAIKKIRIPKRQALIQEAKIGMHLNHPCLMKIYNLWEKKYSNGESKFKLEIEFCKGNTLENLSKSQKTAPASAYYPGLKKAGECLLYLHAQGIHWGDMHEDNVLINDQCNFKFIDFGAYTIQPDARVCVEKLFSEYAYLLGELRRQIPSLKDHPNFLAFRQAIQDLSNQLEKKLITPEEAINQFQQLNDQFNLN